LNKNVLKEFSIVFEAIKHFIENNLQITDQAYNGEFIRDEMRNSIKVGDFCQLQNGDCSKNSRRHSEVGKESRAFFSSQKIKKDTSDLVLRTTRKVKHTKILEHPTKTCFF
jgi:thymidylate synthase ThyX